MNQNAEELLRPPADVPHMRRGDWLALSAVDPIVEYLDAAHWPGSDVPPIWEMARLSRAAYVYREAASGWAVVAKFYTAKVGPEAVHYAGRELGSIQQARASGLAEGDHRALQPLATWRGILFQEYVEGLTLEDTIAVRRSQPGVLVPRLENTARLLATLHAHSVQRDNVLGFQPAVDYAFEVIDNLAKYGVLKDDPIARDGLHRLIEAWVERPQMAEFTSTLTHGDATTTNFIFPWSGGIVAVDWERLHVGDPASDLGRLMAEVIHSMARHGGNVGEAKVLLQRLADAYRHAIPPSWDADALFERACFYRATSTLRIARNGWLSRLERTTLVVQAMAILI
jgi:hypothetical protein